jgi:signal transduction histidine kinase/DNA-binding response OmpR family regulator
LVGEGFCPVEVESLVTIISEDWCVAEIDELQTQVKELQEQVAKLKRTNEILKRRAVQAVVGNKVAGGDELLSRDEERTRIELAGRVKSAFLENVSHEIRSSMNGIIGLTNLVLETELSPEQRQFLQMVNSSVDRLLGVVNEVLDFSRIETGELELETEDFNLKKCLDHDLYLLKQSADLRGLELTCEIARDVPQVIHGDPARIVQLVTNLVSNGIKYTEHGGVRIAIDNEGYDDENRILLRFTVKDTGCGIPAEKLELISQYFRARPKSPVPEPLSIGTTGLGLTISRQLVRLMEGHIEVTSDTSGTTFSFTVPCKEAANEHGFEEQANATVENIKEHSAYVLKGVKVLLAEDEFINRTLLETILRNFGMDVTAVGSGEEAVKEACGGDYRMVLMDVQMEGVNGLEATRRIRKWERKTGGRVGIIALTALALPGDREKCLQAGMDDYLSKPVNTDDLLTVLTEFLSKRALLMDSDPVSQNIFLRTLIEAGWQVTIAETERVAMYEAALSQFDLILLDLSSSHLGGLDAAKLIRRLENYSGRRSVMLGIGGENQHVDLTSSGFDGILPRPVTAQAVKSKLNELLPV